MIGPQEKKEVAGLLPVGDAEASVVGEVALVGSLPGDGGPGTTADLTPEGDALAAVAGDISQGHEELWGNWEGGNREAFKMRSPTRGVLICEINGGLSPS